MGETVTMLCVDDREDGETFDLQLERDRVARCAFDGDDPRRLARFGHVVQSEREARTALLRVLNAGSSLPDIVLIDNMLAGVGRERYVEDGLKLMAWIRDELGSRKLGLPACMLWTARPTPGLAHTFVCCGGVQVIDRALTWPDQLDAIWQGYDWHVAGGDARWTHAPREGRAVLDLPPSCVALLPYLADDVPVPDIAAALGIKNDDVVHDRRRALVRKINEHVPERLLPDGKALLLNGRSASLAKIAQDHGHVWVPLAFRRYLDDANG